MQINHKLIKLIAGVDNLSLDKRKFDLSRDDIERICRFFLIGKLNHYEKEKGIIVSHSNFFVFVATTQGQYALKFYPTNTAKSLATEYAISRILTHHLFPIPIMYAGHGGQPFFPCNDRLAACYSYIDGLPVWQHIKKQKTIHQINTAMLSLKNILSIIKQRIPLQKQTSLTIAINKLAQESRSLTPYDQKKTIDTSLRDTYRTYQQHKSLFNRQWLHNNINLTNFLIYKKTVYTLDLSHIREDYVLSDLASMVISCLFFDIPKTTIKTIVKDYFSQHKIGPDHFPVLNTLVKMGLVREYLKNIQRKKSIEPSTNPPDLVLNYISSLSIRKESIIDLLKRMNDTSSFMI